MKTVNFATTKGAVIDFRAEFLYNSATFPPLAQWLEQATHNRLVAGSSPAGGTNSNPILFYHSIFTLTSYIYEIFISIYQYK